MSDFFKTVKGISQGLYKEKMSKFISFAEPVQSADEAKAVIKKYQNQYHDARHVCWAYMIGTERNEYLSSDNGEPSVVESLPIVRFMQAGLNAEDAWYASEIWTTLNRIRHKSDENKAKLNAFFTKEGTTQKEYLLSALKFYKENGLYTKD